MSIGALSSRYGHLAIIAGLVGCVMAWVAPYGWSPTALFHFDRTIADTHPLPPGTVVLDVPAYDGASYYELSRLMPKIFQPSRWAELKTVEPSPYSYQRFFVPLLAWLLSLGQTGALPWAFLALNLGAVIAQVFVLRRSTNTSPWIIATLAVCPATIVGLHFSLAEPLTLLLTTVFLLRFSRHESLDVYNLLLLTGLVLTREVMILFVGMVGVWLLFRGRWRELPRLIWPIVAFLGLHGLIYAIKGHIPFLWSTAKNTWPFQAILTLVTGGYGYNRFTATSIPLALGFVLPGLVWTVREYVRGHWRFTVFGSFCFLVLMSLMPQIIWGSITSIGRVITPVYPLIWLAVQERPDHLGRWLQISMLGTGLIAAIGLTSSLHPFHVV